jgi:hypothetical protein
MTCLKWLRLLNEPLKNHALFLLFGSITLVFSLMLYLGWLGACLHMFDSSKVAISLYDHLVFDFWCHLMLLLMIFCRYAWLWPLLLSWLVAPSLLLALVLYWVWALLVHPTPKNQVVPLCPPYIPISNLLFQSTFDLLLSILQIKLFWCYAKIG